MEPNLQKITKIDHVNCFFDPLRKDDSFLILEKQQSFKIGFILNDEIILESDHNLKWENISSILGGFSSINTFNKIKKKINE